MEKILREYKKIPSLLKLYLILILLIRIFLLTQPSFKIDMNDWQAWAARLVDVGPLKFYTSNFFADYLPFYYLFVWGQIDAIPTFLLTFSLYQLEEKKNIVRSLSASVLSFLIKPLNIALFPLMLFRIIKNFSAQKILKASGISLLMFFIVTIPFFPNNPIFGPFEHLLKSLNVYPYTSINAYNFWALF